jgi:hypothetical protein
VQAITAGNAVDIFNLAATNDQMLMFKFGSERSYMDGAGRFSRTLFAASVDAVYNNARAKAAVDDAIAATPIRTGWGAFGIDEPFHPRWGSVTMADLDYIYTHIKNRFPTCPTIVRMSPSDDRLTRAIVNCDIYWAEYTLARGEINAYRANNIAAVEAMGKQLIFGLHYKDFVRPNDPLERVITPDQMRHYGGILASEPSDSLVAMSGWKWTSVMHTQPGMQEAVRYVRDKFASLDP